MTDEHDPHCDFSPLRIAMEHMIYRQEMTLDQATLFFVLYSAGLVKDNFGIQRVKDIFQQAMEELEKDSPTDTFR